MVNIPKKKKKDFKLSEEIVVEFEKLAPSGKQTMIVENLIAEWVSDQKKQRRLAAVHSAYERDRKAAKKK